MRPEVPVESGSQSKGPLQPTASKAELLINCSWPFDPNRVIVREEPGEAAVYGTAFHKAIEAMLKGDPPSPEIDQFILDYATEAKIKLDAYLAANGFAAGRRCVEYSLAYCPRTHTARETSLSADHVYVDLRADEIAGTADLIVVPEDKEASILVLDHKTGVTGDFTKPHKLPQLLVLGYAALAHFKRRSFIPAVLHAPRGGIPQVFEGDACGVDMAGSKFIQALRKAIDAIGDGSLRPNKLCPRCPARHDCPARVVDLVERSGELVEKANLVGSELVLVSNQNALSREEKLGRLHLLLARFRELDAKATAEIKRELREHPELEAIRPDGKVLTVKTKTVERISKASIIRALGKVEGEKLITHLREIGCMYETEQEELHAE